MELYEVTFLIDEYVPSCPPPNLRVENTTSTSITFVWDEVPYKCSNGIIVDFDVNLTRLRNNSVVERRISLTNNEYGADANFTARRFVFRNLGKFEKYCGMVRGGTKVDVGPFSEKVCVYTDQDGMFDWVITCLFA